MKFLGIQSEVKQWKTKKPPKEYEGRNVSVKNMLKIEGKVYNDWITFRPFQKLSIDESYIRIRNGKWFYVCAIIDQHTGKILSCLISIHRDKTLAIRTLNKALNEYDLSGAIIHSDGAMCYLSEEFKNLCKEKNIIQLMNDRPISIQNFPIEKFFDVFKNEFLKTIDSDLRTHTILETLIKNFIDHYNYKRIQKRKGWENYWTPQ